MSLLRILFYLAMCHAVPIVASAGVCTKTESCGSVLLQTASVVDRYASNVTDEMGGRAGACEESSWPDRDHGRVCGSCKVLVNRFNSFYKTCEGYCHRVGRECVGAWEERDDTCEVLHDMACDQTPDSSDAICECSSQTAGVGGGSCYGELAHVATNEGNGVGSRIDTNSAAECQKSCDASSDCQSFTLCPSWSKCWMKDRLLSGDEASQKSGDCRTYFKRQSCTTPTPTPPTPTPSSPTGCAGFTCPSVKVMSYNTEYKNYNSRMGEYAQKIKNVAPALVGLQECQNKEGMAALTGYTASRRRADNSILFDPKRITWVSGGWMPIPRDNYAVRTILWGQFRLGNATIFFFNTHLPHNHNEASSTTTHAKIAGMLLQKRKELGAEDAPTIVVGDMNSHASQFNKVHTGGFESNLEANGFVWAYTARGGPGYGGIDHILYSAAHWTHRSCGDAGTGGSDHTSITCDLTLK